MATIQSKALCFQNTQSNNYITFSFQANAKNTNTTDDVSSFMNMLWDNVQSDAICHTGLPANLSVTENFPGTLNIIQLPVKNDSVPSDHYMGQLFDHYGNPI